MKKALLAIGLAVAGIITIAQAQSFTPVTNPPAITYPPVTWTGSNAQVIANQLLSVTNAQGQLVAPNFGARSALIMIQVSVGTNGQLQAIRAQIR